MSTASSSEGSSPATTTRFVEGIRSGDRRALARLMTVAERDPAGIGEVLGELQDRIGRAHVVGVTGPPGSGKSTLLLRLAETCLKSNRSVGIVAVDPTSPLTGGSVLGDRIRLQELHSDPRVFIRSMASAGMTGGLAARTLDIVDLLDAFGFDMIFIESVGVGQGETDISRVVDSNIVVVVPGLGDDIQALKAGVLETGDVFVVNKSDRPEAKATQATIRAMLELGEHTPWSPPVVATSALKNDGISELLQSLNDHRTYLIESGDSVRRRTGRQIERIRIMAYQRMQLALNDVLDSDEVMTALQSGGQLDSAVRKVLDKVGSRIVSKTDQV